jgi:hypothetical protein
MLLFFILDQSHLYFNYSIYFTMRPIADIFGCNRGSAPNLRADMKAALGEFIGMTIFLFLGLGGVQACLEAPSADPAGLGPTAT